MKNNKIFFILIAFALFLNACKKDNKTNNPYFTFGVAGNSWVYNSNGGSSNATLTITNESNDTCTVAIINNATSQIEHIGYFEISDTEYGAYESTNMSNKSIILKYDAQVGDIYYSITLGDTTVNEITSTSQSITVPAGTFDCYEIKSHNTFSPSIFDLSYINKNAGIIKVIENGQVDMELVSKNF